MIGNTLVIIVLYCCDIVVLEVCCGNLLIDIALISIIYCLI